jgi:hypothetical protein
MEKMRHNETTPVMGGNRIKRMMGGDEFKHDIFDTL